MNTVQGDEQGAAKAFDLGVEAGLSLAQFSGALTARLSAAGRSAPAAELERRGELALAAHRVRHQNLAVGLADAERNGDIAGFAARVYAR